MKKLLASVLSLSFVIAMTIYQPSNVNAREYGEGDRYRPGTCTLIDEEGPVEIAICTKKVADGPCFKEVKCEQPIPE
ncbi:hypothetical protein [Roseivirga sp. E12]|uniref:hypothetical protein n=1 Tax=Roseivirga sp. E12 TaxID=2819237 RepID=UPI001ABCDD22|nr:hypothetical protein [Roseivirga sp. E12]MBO3699874.1 hypothetical protein [Roseivirga sp. E12]